MARNDRGIVREPYEAIDLMYKRHMDAAGAAEMSTYQVATLRARLAKRRQWSDEQWDGQWRPLVDCNWLLEATRIPQPEARDALLAYCLERRTHKGIGMDFIRAVAEGVCRGRIQLHVLLDVERMDEALDRFADPTRPLRG